MTAIDLQRMSREEKLRVMHALWEDLAQDENAVQSPGWHEDALRETEERVQSGVEQVRDWSEAKADLRKRAG
jgi:hypothetical protein